MCDNIEIPYRCLVCAWQTATLYIQTSGPRTWKLGKGLLSNILLQFLHAMKALYVYFCWRQLPTTMFWLDLGLCLGLKCFSLCFLSWRNIIVVDNKEIWRVSRCKMVFKKWNYELISDSVCCFLLCSNTHFSATAGIKEVSHCTHSVQAAASSAASSTNSLSLKTFHCSWHLQTVICLQELMRFL